MPKDGRSCCQPFNNQPRPCWSRYMHAARNIYTMTLAVCPAYPISHSSHLQTHGFLNAQPHRHYPIPREQDVFQPCPPDTDLGKPARRGSGHDLAHPYPVRRDDHMDVDPPHSSRASQYEEPAHPRELGNRSSSHTDGRPHSPSVRNPTLCCKVTLFFLFLPSHPLTCRPIQDMPAPEQVHAHTGHSEVCAASPYVLPF